MSEEPRTVCGCTFSRFVPHQGRVRCGVDLERAAGRVRCGLAPVHVATNDLVDEDPGAMHPSLKDGPMYEHELSCPCASQGGNGCPCRSGPHSSDTRIRPWSNGTFRMNALLRQIEHCFRSEPSVALNIDTARNSGQRETLVPISCLLHYHGQTYFAHQTLTLSTRRSGHACTGSKGCVIARQSSVSRHRSRTTGPSEENYPSNFAPHMSDMSFCGGWNRDLSGLGP